MQSLETFKSKGQAKINELVELGKAQPTEVKTWGITGGAAVVGAVTLSAVAHGVVAIVATIANPPVALTLGALAGGALGWSFMQKSQAAADNTTPAPEASAAEVAPVLEAPTLSEAGASA